MRRSSRPAIRRRSIPARWMSSCTRRSPSTTGPRRTSPEKIEEVRQLYLDTLKSWPHESVPKIGLRHGTAKKRQPGSAAKKAPKRPAKKLRQPYARRRPQKGSRERRSRPGQTAVRSRRPAKKAPRRRQEGQAVTATDPMASFSTTDDALVLASVSSPAERELLSDWLQRQRREHPDSQSRGARAAAKEIRRLAYWRASSRNSRPTRTARSFRCASSGCPAACRRARRWSRSSPAATPTVRRRSCSVASSKRTRPAHAWSLASPRRFPSSASSGATPRLGENPRDFAHFVIRRASLGHRTRRAAAARTRVQVASTDQAGDPGVDAFSRGPREDPRRDPGTGGGDARRALHRMESVLRRPDPVAGQGDLQSRLRPEHRLRPRRDRSDAARSGELIRRCCCSRTGRISTV